MKWYADAVAPDGTALIAYHAELRWRGAAVRLGSVLRAPAQGEVAVLVTARPGRAPVFSDATLTWPASRLFSGGRWTPLALPFARTLLSRGGRTLDWSCVAPAARVVIEGDGQLEGLGYAERLEMTLAPWRLPIRELRWGRFVSDRASMTWIDWQGEAPLRLVLHGGRVAAQASVDERHVATAEATLTLAAPRVLRDGPLGTLLLSHVPLVGKSLPARLLSLHETKWLARGVLEDRAGRHEGWVIHEVVRWP